MAPSPSGGGGGKKAWGEPEDPAVAAEHDAFQNYLMLVCGCLAALLIVWRLYNYINGQIRTMVCLTNDKQRYFAYPSAKLAFFKRNFLYAPVFRKRHNREFQLSTAVNVGTLPTRLELVFLIGYFATNVVFSIVGIPFTEKFGTAVVRFRDRTGILAVINMVPLFVMAGRNNPLIALLGMSFDTFNLLHRWFGRIVVLEAVAHTIAHVWSMAKDSTWTEAWLVVFRVEYMLWGFIATVAFVAIALQAVSPLRHAFYEIFKVMHIVLAIASIIGLWYHLKLKDLPQLKILGGIIAIWCADRLTRLVLIAYRNLGGGGTKTLVEALPGNACRITVTLPRPWRFRAGQHAYLYFPSLSYWQSHPFSVTWGEDGTEFGSEKLAVSMQDRQAKKSTISFIARERTGVTHSLYAKAIKCPDGRFTTKCLVEGPYGSIHSLNSYGTVMLFAGGVGITHQVPYVKELVAGYANGTVATRKLVLVWTIQSPEHLEWIRPWMTEVLAMDRRREVLRIMLFVSRPRSTKEIHSPSATVQMFPGRPNIETLIGIEMEQQVGAMVVSVCGPGTLSDEVRRAVRNRQYTSTVDFVEEAFTW